MVSALERGSVWAFLDESASTYELGPASALAGVTPSFLSRLVNMLPHLESLLFTESSIYNFGSLASAKQMTQLDLSGCLHMNDVTPLTFCSKLSTLRLRGCEYIPDITPLASCPLLVALNLKCCCGIFDFGALALCTALRALNLGDTRIFDLTPLASCTRLSSLELCDLEDTIDIRPLAACTSLNLLSLDGCHSIQDFRVLAAPCSPHLELAELQHDGHQPTSLMHRAAHFTSLRFRDRCVGCYPVGCMHKAIYSKLAICYITLRHLLFGLMYFFNLFGPNRKQHFFICCAGRFSIASHLDSPPLQPHFGHHVFGLMH